MSLKLTAKKIGYVTVIDAAGTITLGDGASRLRDFIRDQVDKGNKKFVLIVAGVQYIDTSGMAELVNGSTYVASQGGEIKLVALTKRIKDLLQIMELYTGFDICDDEAEAVRNFS